MYQYIREVVRAENFKPSIMAVDTVSELPKKVAYAILSKADEMKWNREAVRVVKNAMESLSEEVVAKNTIIFFKIFLMFLAL